MFSQEENKILDSIYFQEFIELCNFDFFELITFEMILDGYKTNEIADKLGLKERNFFKKLKKISDKICLIKEKVLK